MNVDVLGKGVKLGEECCLSLLSEVSTAPMTAVKVGQRSQRSSFQAEAYGSVTACSSSKCRVSYDDEGSKVQWKIPPPPPPPPLSTYQFFLSCDNGPDVGRVARVHRQLGSRHVRSVRPSHL